MKTSFKVSGFLLLMMCLTANNNECFSQTLDRAQIVEIENEFSSDVYKMTPYGIEERSTGKIHILIDANGFLILRALPNGIAGKTYVVHVYYNDIITGNQNFKYGISQTKGGYNSDIIIKADLSLVAPEVKTLKRNEVIFELRNSNKDDIEFKIDRIKIADESKNKSWTYSIKMNPYYNATVNGGIMFSKLENPTFELIGVTDTTNTVKKANGGNRPIISSTATIYFSPVYALRYALSSKSNKESKLQKEKIYSRNFLNDHKLLERIYPTVGLAISEQVFENIFLGVNFEPIRGLSIFYGQHYGRVNTFKNDFDFGNELISESQFNLRTNKEWKWQPVFGINLDLKIFNSVFKTDG